MIRRITSKKISVLGHDNLRRRVTRLRPAAVEPVGKQKARAAAKPHQANISSKQASVKDTDELTEDGEIDEWLHGKSLLKPDDQVQLTEAELKEEFTRILTAKNPHAPQNIVRYSFKEKQFKQMAPVDQLVIHFALDGSMLHIDSDEAKRQLANLQTREKASEQALAEPEEQKEESQGDKEAKPTDEKGVEREEKGKNGETERAEPSPEEEKESSPTSKEPEGKLTNQFNFSERATQTYNNPYRERGIMTEPPPRATYNSNVNQWEIYDAYQDDFEKQPGEDDDDDELQFLLLSSFSSAPQIQAEYESSLQEKNKDKKLIHGKKEDETIKMKLTISEMQGDDISRVSNAVKIMERMVNQNTFDDIAQDFKYWEDQSDEYRDQEGTLLPLWRFSFDKARGLSVTSLCWNPKYKDMFVVSLGSYEFTKQGSGMILFYSLKNPTYPEYCYKTDSGVMSIDVHPTRLYLVCAGFYDGSVAIYSVCKQEEPLQRCTAKNGRHTDPVWQVRWQKDNLDGNPNFFSIASDGRIVAWTIIKNELIYQDVIKLLLPDVSSDGPEGTKLATFGCGTTFDFHKHIDYLYVAGTEEGRIHTCSKDYRSKVLDTIDAHSMAVYRVSWNNFHPKIFITCSADWTVKIWENGSKSKYPLFTFDLNSSVGDVAWAPYSSTVFAAATAHGKVYIYDLNINKYEPLCEQVVAQKKKTKMTHIAFNPLHPIIIVGDDRGHITSLKLSPNLRKMPKFTEEPDDNSAPKSPGQPERKGQPPLDKAAREQQEIAKLEKILIMVREAPPPTEN